MLLLDCWAVGLPVPFVGALGCAYGPTNGAWLLGGVWEKENAAQNPREKKGVLHVRLTTLAFGKLEVTSTDKCVE